MVRAILSGQKTQTRRVLKYQQIRCTELPFLLFPQSRNESVEQTGFIWPNAKEQVLALCPYGQPGDRLWVREAWATHVCFDNIPPRDLTTRSIHYQADGKVETGKYRQAFFMPRWASRILLEVTGVRVERLQDISEEDAKAEGADCLITANCTAEQRELLAMPLMDDATPYRNGYALLWESINGDGSWEANPWVWVIEFKRLEGGAA